MKTTFIYRTFLTVFVLAALITCSKLSQTYLEPPLTVTITAPNGGELWYVDQEYDITWEAAADDSVTSYKLEYTADEGSTWIDIQDWTAGNPQTYSWLVPPTPSTRHLVRVSCQDLEGNITSDVSDTLFMVWPEGGMIAFTSDLETDNSVWDIFIMFADGSHPRNITNNGDGNDYHASWSPDCSKIAFTSTRDGIEEIYVMNSDGTNPINISNSPSSVDQLPSWSPNGDKIAFTSNRDDNDEIYIMNPDGTEQENLTNNPTSDVSCSWSPTGALITFHSTRGGNTDLYIMDNDGTAQTSITTEEDVQEYPAWSPTASLIVYRVFTAIYDFEIFLMNVDGTEQHNISNNPSADHIPKWSPDGEWILFYSNRTQDFEIYKMSTDGFVIENLSNSPSSGEHHPSWSPIY